MRIVTTNDQKKSLMLLVGIGRYVNKIDGDEDLEYFESVNEALAELAYVIGGIGGCAQVGREIFNTGWPDKPKKKENDYQKFANEVVDMLNSFCDDDDQINIKKCEVDVNMKYILEEFV
jgi:hypothetical protein